VFRSRRRCMRFRSFLQVWQSAKRLSHGHGCGCIHDNNAHGTGMPCACSRVGRDVQHGYQCVSMTPPSLFEKLRVAFGADLVHFVHLSQTINDSPVSYTLLFLKRRCMAVAGVCASTNSYQALQSTFKQRQQDFQSLADALQAGNLQGAQQAFAALQQDRSSSPHVAGVPGTPQAGQGSPISQDINWLRVL